MPRTPSILLNGLLQYLSNQGWPVKLHEQRSKQSHSSSFSKSSEWNIAFSFVKPVKWSAINSNCWSFTMMGSKISHLELLFQEPQIGDWRTKPCLVWIMRLHRSWFDSIRYASFLPSGKKIHESLSSLPDNTRSGSGSSRNNRLYRDTWKVRSFLNHRWEVKTYAWLIQ